MQVDPALSVHSDGAELRWQHYPAGPFPGFKRFEIHRSATANFTPSATTSAAVAVTRANSAAPTTSITAATAGGGGVWTVDASASDDVGVTNVEFYVDDVTIPGDPIGTNESTNFQLSLAPPTLPTGVDRARYRLQLDIYDQTRTQTFPYGAGTRAATRAQVESAARRIYANYPEILRALRLP